MVHYPLDQRLHGPRREYKLHEHHQADVGSRAIKSRPIWVIFCQAIEKSMLLNLIKNGSKGRKRGYCYPLAARCAHADRRVVYEAKAVVKK